MSAAAVDRLTVGRQRPAPPWRRWRLIDLKRRDLARFLKAEVEAAQGRDDEALVELLGPVADALDSLVEPAEGIQK